jgi:hypothetical protein
MFTLQTSFKPFYAQGGGKKSLSLEVTVKSKEENSLRLLSQLLPTIRPQYTAHLKGVAFGEFVSSDASTGICTRISQNRRTKCCA